MSPTPNKPSFCTLHPLASLSTQAVCETLRPLSACFLQAPSRAKFQPSLGFFPKKRTAFCSFPFDIFVVRQDHTRLKAQEAPCCVPRIKCTFSYPRKRLTWRVDFINIYLWNFESRQKTLYYHKAARNTKEEKKKTTVNRIFFIKNKTMLNTKSFMNSLYTCSDTNSPFCWHCCWRYWKSHPKRLILTQNFTRGGNGDL